MLVTENLNGHAAGNGRYSQGDTYGPAVASSTRSVVLRQPDKQDATYQELRWKSSTNTLAAQ
jgi:hypothetical protein